MVGLLVERAGESGWPSASRRPAGHAGASAGSSSRPRGSTRSPRSPRRRCRSASPRSLHGSGLPRRLSRPALVLGLGADSGEALGGDLPRGPRLGRADRRCSSPWACSSSRRSSATSRSRAPRWPWSSPSSHGPLAAFWRRSGSAFTLPERTVLGWAGPARRDPGGVRHVRGDRGRRRGRRDLQHRLLRGPALDRAPGHDLRAGRHGAGRDDVAARRCRARWPRPARSARSAPRWSSTRSRPTTPRSGPGSATSGCPATRSST